MQGRFNEEAKQVARTNEFVRRLHKASSELADQEAEEAVVPGQSELPQSSNEAPLLWSWMGCCLRSAQMIGAGTYAMVYRATTATGMEVAVKSPRSVPEDDQFGLEDISKEYSLLVSLSICPFIVRALGLALTGGSRPAMVLELCAFNLFRAVMTEDRDNLTAATRWKICGDISLALQFLAERHVLHMDLKLDNILLQNELYGYMKAVLSDFGLSRTLVQRGNEMRWDCEMKINGGYSSLYRPPELTAVPSEDSVA